MERLHRAFNASRNSGEFESLLLIPAYVLDFLCIHPFLDGNGRMSRLLTLLLLYQAGYEVGRYVSLERLIERTAESYYDVLRKSSQGWHEGEQDLSPWIEYFLGILVAAYREFEESVERSAHG
jgi:Fic family protein